MPIVLSDLLTPTEARVLREAAAGLDYTDGAATAGTLARAVKDNEQATGGGTTEAVLEKVRRALLSHPGFQAVAYPKSIARLMVSRTRDGGQYGDHVDNALIAGARADISFTLFLSDPLGYEGGALTITDRIEDRAFKLGAGEAIVYPSTTLHRVEPVTAGERIVVVGWIQSWIRDPAQREILFDLWRVIETCVEVEQAESLSKTRSNLIRMWAS